MAYALSELLKGQLELTANFLTTQKTLYANYCASLSHFVPQTDFSSFDKVIYPKKYEPAAAADDPMIVSESSEEKISVIVEEDIQYESEFEDESNNSSSSSPEEDDDTVVPTELSVQSNE